MLGRRQPPVYSPLTLSAITAGALSASRLTADRRRSLTELLRDRYAATAVTLCGSGTEALVLAIRLAERRIDQPSPVALPAFSCFDVASAAVAARARVTVYDVEPDSLSPDLSSLERLLAAGSRIVVIAPLYGLPVDYDAIATLLARYDALAIEDAAQGQGAGWRGRPLGSFGPISVLSFGRGKGWSGGRGGALLVRGPGLTSALASLNGEAGPPSELGALITAGAQWALGRPRLYSLPAAMPWLGLGETRYRDAPPQGRLARAAAGMLERMFEPAEGEADARRANAESLLSRLSFGQDVRNVRAPAGSTPGYLRLPIRLSRGLSGFGEPERARRLGIATSYPSPLAALEPIRARMIAPADRCPGAEELARELITLPTHTLLSDRERSAVARLIGDYPQ